MGWMKVYTEVPHCSVMVTLLGSYKGSDFSIKKATGRLLSLTKRGMIPFSNKPTFIILFILYNSMALHCHLLLLSLEGNEIFTINFRTSRSREKCHSSWNFLSNTKTRDAILRLKCSEKTKPTKFMADKTLRQQLKRETIISCANRS